MKQITENFYSLNWLHIKDRTNTKSIYEIPCKLFFKKLQSIYMRNLLQLYKQIYENFHK